MMHVNAIFFLIILIYFFQLTIDLEETKAKLAVASSEDHSPKPEPIDDSLSYKEEIKNLKSALVVSRRNIEQLTLEKHNLHDLHNHQIEKIKLACKFKIFKMGKN